MLQQRSAGQAGQRHQRRRKRKAEAGRKYVRPVAKTLRKGKKQQAGRHHGGRVTVRHRGGGVKRKRRRRVNGGKESGMGRVRGIQHDPNRTGRVARRKVRETDTLARESRYKYVLAAEGRKAGDTIQYGDHGKERASFVSFANEANAANYASKQRTRGSTRQRKNRVAGMKVCNIAVEKGEGGKYRRSAGAWGELRQKRHGSAQIRRKGGKRREVSDTCTATVGMVSGEEHQNESRGKAGTRRRRGWRPQVRGEAMNPVDHPHGGRTRGGGPEVTPWARRAKGKPTRKSGGVLGKGWSIFRSVA